MPAYGPSLLRQSATAAAAFGSKTATAMRNEGDCHDDDIVQPSFAGLSVTDT
jgi:hypothetical protein